VTLQLGTDETGPTEIGGLVLTPAYRGHRAKLGALLSLIRFHYIGLYREMFSDRVIAEMAAPITPDSRNTLWEYLGRRFINLEYTEADRFCRQSKEFVTSLFPKGEIYASLLPPEARNLIGKVSPEAEPAKAMLEALGFKYLGHCDPFDGGPYLEASLSQVPLVINTRRAQLGEPTHELGSEGFVSVTGSAGFRGLRAKFHTNDSGDVISISSDQMALLGAKVGDVIGITPRTASRPHDTGEASSRAGSRVSVSHISTAPQTAP